MNEQEAKKAMQSLGKSECWKCGRWIRESWKFCRNCGERNDDYKEVSGLSLNKKTYEG